MRRCELTCVVAIGTLALIAGCDQNPASGSFQAANSSQGKTQASSDTRVAKRLASAEYSTLAASLADPLLDERNQTTAKKEVAQLLAEARVKVVRYQSLNSDDPLIAEIAKQAAESGAAMVKSHEAILVAEQDDPLSDLARIGIGWYAGNPGVMAGGAEGILTKVDAMQQERIRWASAFNRSRAAQLMLPASAKAWAGPASESRSLVSVDFDESFAGSADHDSIALSNVSGVPLTNCTVLVELRNQEGETRQNVHFVPSWETGKVRFARYAIGFQSGGNVYGRQTVNGVQELRVSVWADEASQENAVYMYAGAERDKDIKAILDGKMNVRYRYDARPLFRDGPDVYVYLRDIPLIPEHTFEITFVPKKGSTHQPLTLEWKQKQWNNDQERVLTVGNKLKFDPEGMRFKVQFPGSSYEYVREMETISK